MTAPAVNAPGAGGGLGVAGWLYLGALLAYIAVIVWVSMGRPPVRASLLHALMTGSQSVARHVGTFGLHAEAAYRRHISAEASG